MAEARLERRLAAIVAADVAGYSRLMESDEAGTFARLKRLRLEVLEPILHRHGGRIVDLKGDGAMIEFASAVDAVEAAVSVQRAVLEQEAQVPDDRRIRFRIGINLGDVLVDGDTIYGDGVNVAARIESLCEPGGVWLSRSVYNQVKGKLDLAFAPAGLHQVKNISEMVETFRVALDGVMPAAPLRRARARRWLAYAAAVLVALVLSGGVWWSRHSHDQPPRGRPSIAVLPFDNPQAADGALAAGLAEDILTELSRNRDLRVIARDSSFELAGQHLPQAEIGRRLGVRYLLAGSVARAGDMLRVNARLLDTATGEYVWADRFTPRAADLYAAQDGIVREITGRLASEVRESEKARALRRPPGSLDVYDLTQRGLAEKHKLDRDSLIAARADLERAVALDPGYAPAQLFLAQVDLLDIGSGGITGRYGEADLPDVVARTRRAVELEPDASEGYRILSQALGRSGDTRGALQAAERSVQLAPSNADNLNFLGVAQIRAGRYEDALRSITEALDLNPVGPAWYHVYKAQALYALERAREALEPADACAVRAARWVFCHVIKAAALSALGDESGAKASVASLLALNPRYDLATAGRLTPFPGDPAATARYVADLRRAGLPGDAVAVDR
jgi:adenylate cyclase